MNDGGLQGTVCGHGPMIGRQLQAHVPDATTLLQEEDANPCATTETWNVFAKALRTPRSRPGRRTQSSRGEARRVEEATVTRLLANSIEDELDFDLGLLPLRSSRVLSECLESDEEMEMTLEVGSGREENETFIKGADEHPVASGLPSAAPIPLVARKSERTLKRKLEEVDFEVLDRAACEAEEEARQEAASAAHIEKCKQFSQAAFLAQVQMILQDLVGICGTRPISTCDEIKILHAKVTDKYEHL